MLGTHARRLHNAYTLRLNRFVFYCSAQLFVETKLLCPSNGSAVADNK